MVKRSILMSLLVIGAVTALVGFTVAQFSDTEKSDNNVITTLDLNLQLGTTPSGLEGCVYEDPFTGKFFDIHDAKPGDVHEVTICVWNDGGIAGDLTFDVSGLTDTEPGCTEPEAVAEAANNGDGTTGVCATNGEGTDGELSENVTVDIWVDMGDNGTPCDNVNSDPTVDEVWVGGDLWFFSGDLDTLAAYVDTEPSPMAADEELCFGIKATVNPGAGNEIQLDMVTADITFTLVQAP